MEEVVRELHKVKEEIIDGKKEKNYYFSHLYDWFSIDKMIGTAESSLVFSDFSEQL